MAKIYYPSFADVSSSTTDHPQPTFYFKTVNQFQGSAIVNLTWVEIPIEKTKLEKAIEWLGERWVLHPNNRVKRMNIEV